MLDSIHVQNFKRIGKKPLKLEKLASVNYLVGENGSGKSSVLEALLNEKKPEKILVSYNYKPNKKLIDEIKKKHWISFDEAGKKLEIFLNSKETELKISSDEIYIFTDKYNGVRLNFLKEKGLKDDLMFKGSYALSIQNSLDDLYPNISVDIKLFTNNECQFLENKHKNMFFDKETNTETDLEIVNKLFFNKLKPDTEVLKDFLNEYFYQNDEVKEILRGLNDDEALVITKTFQKHFLKDFASGYQNLYSLYSSIIAKLPKPEISANNYSIYLIEEPEIGIHPSYQKLLPSMFSKFSTDYNAEFLITTHSPFIISAAAGLPDQKVYLIENGETKDVDSGELNTERSQSGYSGGECLLAVNEMLGSQAEHISSAVIFCEKSLCCLLEEIGKQDNSKFKRAFVFTPQGSGSDPEIFKNVEKAYKFNYSQILVYGIIDKNQQVEREIKAVKNKKLNSNLPEEEQNSLRYEQLAAERTFVSTSEELELLYNIDDVNEFLHSKSLPKWDKIECPSFSTGYLKKDIKNDSNQNTTIKSFYKEKYKNDLKNDLAIYIGSKVDKEFVKEISPELYSVIF